MEALKFLPVSMEMRGRLTSCRHVHTKEPWPVMVGTTTQHPLSRPQTKSHTDHAGPGLAREQREQGFRQSFLFICIYI